MRFKPGTILPPANPSSLDKFEDYYLGGLKLPAAFRAFMATHNGAAPVNDDNSIYSEAFGDDIVIERFLPQIDDYRAHPDSWAEFEVILTQISERTAYGADAEHEHLIPFALLFAGDYLVLDYYTNQTEPAVAVWDHERSLPDAPHAPVIAENFEAFLHLFNIELPE